MQICATGGQHLTLRRAAVRRKRVRRGGGQVRSRSRSYARSYFRASLHETDDGRTGQTAALGND